MKRLTASAILAADDLPRRDVACPEWGGEVTVRALTVGERQRFLALAKDGDTAPAAEVVAMAAIDADGRPIFTPDDAVKLSGKAGHVVERLAAAILDLSGMLVTKAPEKN